MDNVKINPANNVILPFEQPCPGRTIRKEENSFSLVTDCVQGLFFVLSAGRATCVNAIYESPTLSSAVVKLRK